ncbi:sodium:solute symporter family transporter [Robertkochia aurantiaca]|uniref:sodium:solute symporter family transporter n=1 Tax=Robertkochia aurantiaca TaxID=2873700 RepID=UPI001CC9DA5C|nr:sodium:solute symporter [Robertkochia sp. 3YJGBD-33]
MDAFSRNIITASLVLFALFLIGVAIKSRSKSDNLRSYAVGSITFTPLSVALALAASLTSAATFIINPGFISLYGLSAYLAFGVVMPLAIFVALAFLIKRFRKYGVNVGSLSIADWLGKRYNSKFLQILFGFLSILLVTFIVLICVGITKVVAKALDANEIYVLITVVAIVFGYIMLGGANAMVYTNSLQAVIMIVVAGIMLTSGAEQLFAGEGSDMFSQLAAIDPDLVKPFNEKSPLFRDFFEVVVCNAIIGIAIVCQPHILTKSLLLKKDEQVNRFLIYSVLILILFFSVVFTGFYARLHFPDLTMNGEALQMDGIISAYVVSKFSVYVSILLIIGLIAAGLSTLEGLIQSIPTTITNDLILPLLGSERADRSAITINRWVAVGIAVMAVLLSVDQLRSPNLSVGIFAQNGVYAFFSAAFVPVLFGIFTKTQNKWLAIISSLIAVGTHFSIYYFELTPYMKGVDVKNPAVASALALILSTLVGLVIYLVKPAKSTVKVNKDKPVTAF